VIYFEMSIFRRSSKLIYSKWYCFIKNNKTATVLHFQFCKRGNTVWS